MSTFRLPTSCRWSSIRDWSSSYLKPPCAAAGSSADWYAGGGGHPGVINLFFDEVHTLSLVEARSEGPDADVKVVVNWQCRRWTAPAPRSEWLGFDAFQTWRMIRSPETGRPVISRYVVDELRPMPGSPPL